MAGSGKTTLIQRINAHLHTQKRQGYIINLDPAVTHVPYGANIDIRDTVRGALSQPQHLCFLEAAARYCALLLSASQTAVRGYADGRADMWALL